LPRALDFGDNGTGHKRAMCAIDIYTGQDSNQKIEKAVAVGAGKDLTDVFEKCTDWEIKIPYVRTINELKLAFFNYGMELTAEDELEGEHLDKPSMRRGRGGAKPAVQWISFWRRTV
jgi:hypothetical protein